MPRHQTCHSTKIFNSEFVRTIKSSVFIILFLSQVLLEHEQYMVTAISQHSTSSTSLTSSSSSTASSSTPQAKLGAYMVRQPESTIAPLFDEVLFECGLNLIPDRLEWRFRPQTSTSTATKSSRLSSSSLRTGSGQKVGDFIYLNKTAGYNVTTEDSVSKLRVYVNQQSPGEYQCIAWLGAAALASIPAKLLLADISVSTSSSPRAIHWKVSPGNSILINCDEVVSNPPPVWSFYKDNQPVPNSIPQLPTGALVLQSLTPADSGTYWCSAVNSITGAEVKTQQKITVTVDYTSKGPPMFLSTPATHVIVKPGATAILECPGVGYPVPKAVWSRPDASISNNRTSIFGYGLQILNARPEDRGEYICRLDNGIAPVLMNKIRLDLLEAPTIERGPIDTLTDEGESLELECSAKGFPIPTTYWLINGVDTRLDPSIHTDGNRLLINALEKKHAGIVQCFARNEVGEVCKSKLLQVKPIQISGEVGGAQPLGTIPHLTKANHEHNGKLGKGRKKHKHTVMVPPSRPNVTRLSDEKVMVRWSVPPRESLPIQFFKVQYRLLGSTPKTPKRSQWMTSNEDIPPTVRMYEVDNLKPDNYYRFRIAAVYSNNDNQLSNASKNFLLLRGSQLDPKKSHLPAPNLTLVEPISENAVVLHWFLPDQVQAPIDGFYAYYRPASTAGEYSKATVDGMDKRNFKIDNLEPGTAYEFKLQSYTSSAASDFLAIITGFTLKPSTPPPIDPSVITQSGGAAKMAKPYVLLVAGATGAGSILLLTLILLCIFMKRRKKSSLHDANENKAHPDHIQGETNGFPVGSVGSNGRILSSPVHKTSRLNGVVPRMNITPNPLATDGDKNRNVMELRFLPTSLPPTMTNIQQNQHSHPYQPQQQQPQQNNNFEPSPGADQHHRRTVDRNNRNLGHLAQQTPPQQQQHQHQQPHPHQSPYPPINAQGGGMGSTGDMGIQQTDMVMNRAPSLRRTPRRTTTGNGIPVPNSPRFIRSGISNDMLQHNRSPIPSRVAAAVAAGKRNRLGSRNNENISSGSLNSIEV